jgi:hypothetical protein
LPGRQTSKHFFQARVNLTGAPRLSGRRRVDVNTVSL